MKPSYFKISFGEGLCLRLGLTGPLVDSIAAPGALLLITIPLPGPYPSPTELEPAFLRVPGYSHTYQVCEVKCEVK